MKKLIKIVSDLSTLTTISEKTLSKLSEKLLYIVCEAIEESILDNEEITEFNFFDLFNISIKHAEGEPVKYRMVPTEKLEKSVNLTVKNKLNLLEDGANKTLKDKFLNIYKDIC